MKTLRRREALRAWRASARRAGRSVALVPTMGNLHEGHLSLVRIARGLADATVVSLFVNPMQFGPGEDFARYPRTFRADSARCRAEGVDLLFAPDVTEMYARDCSTAVEETGLSAGLCGAARPGHFRGVCTAVALLFNLVEPDVAVFGEKDAQQLRVIRRMTRDLGFPVRVVSGPTVREPDGLALSSRNRYLTPAQRRAAPRLYAALREAARCAAAGERRAAALCAAMESVLAGAPEARVEYVAVVDDETLAPIRTLRRPALAALAVQFGDCRLIDNLRLVPSRGRGSRTDQPVSASISAGRSSSRSLPSRMSLSR